MFIIELEGRLELVMWGTGTLNDQRFIDFLTEQEELTLSLAV